MNSAQMFYRKLSPAPEFSHLVLSFGNLRASDSAPVKHEIFPDGCISLFYYRNASFGMEKLALTCLQMQPVEVPIFPATFGLKPQKFRRTAAKRGRKFFEMELKKVK